MERAAQTALRSSHQPKPAEKGRYRARDLVARAISSLASPARSRRRNVMAEESTGADPMAATDPFSIEAGLARSGAKRGRRSND
jgi:hypothetical protein